MDNFGCTINFIELKAVALIFRSVWTVERSFENTIIWHKIFSIYRLNEVDLFAMNQIFFYLSFLFIASAEEFPNLRAYSDRMKAKFWPDWNQVVTKPDLAL